ncbi:MAG: MjaI family restriction endonuclease [Candidatus Saccharimonas sp.]
MTTQPHRQINAHELISGVIEDPDYERNSQRTSNLRHAFTTTALALAEMGTDKAGKRTRLADQLDVSAQVPGFIASVTAIDTAKTGNYTLLDDVREKYVSNIVGFNHSLEAMIKADPEASFNEVMKFLMGMYAYQYSDRTDEQTAAVQKHLEERLTGMVSEVIFDQLAEYSNYQVEGASVEDDMSGIDRFIKVGKDWIGVDVKTSSDIAREARVKHPENFIVSMGIPKETMRGRLCLSANSVARYAPAFKEEVKRELERHGFVV